MGAVPPKRNCTLCNTLTLNTFHLPEIIVAALQSCNITLCVLTANYSCLKQHGWTHYKMNLGESN